ncbi:spermidine synthase [Streptomyces sp. ST2-7A]|uniref:spermidine synthase n=1 Tax=Streptomyces sp. ST2-7A TaxID=2907214 RepID=UPI001F3CE434|nr:fused MFS/spermidine synthase [Streptomyces sp. ST2-7A]MCE7079411.1 fused MFS/spermidine synthase [Streptomyces sp. ST2-7A]
METEPLPVVVTVDSGVARLLPDLDRRRARLLTLDGAPQSWVDPDDPERLEFEYVRHIAALLTTAMPGEGPVDALHLGGGALTLPRWLQHLRPGSRQLVVEHDAALAALVVEHLPLPAGAPIRIRVADARDALEEVPEDGVDVVVADVWAGNRIPARCTTIGFARAAARAVRPAGLHVANLADAAPLDFARSQLAALREVFAHVYVITEPSVLRGRRYGNLVVAASHRPLDPREPTRRVAADPFPARLVLGDEVDRLIGDARPPSEEEAAPSPAPPPGTFRLR